MSARLRFALERAALHLPEQGLIGLINAPADVDLLGLAPDRLRIVQSFRPAYDALAARGLAVAAAPEDSYAAALITCDRDRGKTRDLVAQALVQTAPGGLITIDGAKTDGIAQLARDLDEIAPSDSLAKAHGRLLWFTRPEPLPDLAQWQARPARNAAGFLTRAGVFSAGDVDTGSALLARHLSRLAGRGADLGAGWGYLSAQVLGSEAVTALDLVEAEALACALARDNIGDHRAKIHWADVTTWQADPYDFIVTNPPFHHSRKADPALGQGFLAAAARLLKPKGQLWLVANRGLPYEATLDALFHQNRMLHQAAGFKILHAKHPRRGA